MESGVGTFKQNVDNSYLLQKLCTDNLIDTHTKLNKNKTIIFVSIKILMKHNHI